MFRIIEANSSLDFFKIKGNHVAGFPNGATFTVRHSSVGNNGNYTVIGSSLDIQGNTDISVASVPFDSVFDGAVNLNITAVVSGAGGSFEVAGDFSTYFVSPRYFKVFGSTGNDGLYQVNSSSFSLGFTTVVITGTVPSAIVDGDLVSVTDYIIDFSDPSKPTLLIGESVTDSSTSVKLSGKGVINYGEDNVENILHLLENFASPTSPSNPIEGQIWFDTSTSPAKLKVYNGVSFVLAGGTDFVLKAGDTMDLNADLTFNGGEVLGLPVTPSATGASSKEYVDNEVGTVSSALSTHISDDTLHITSDQNTFLDGLNLPTLTATEVNYLVGVTSDVQTQLNDKLSTTTLTPQSVDSTVSFNDDVDLASGKNITFQGGGEVLGLPAIPTDITAGTSKQYVDNLVSSGTVWKAPITDPNLQGAETSDPGVVGSSKTYIAYGGAYPQTWGTITDVAQGDVLTRNDTDTDWVRIASLISGIRFIVAGEQGTSDTEFYSAGIRNGDLIEYISGDPDILSSWNFPHDDGYQVIVFNTPKSSTDLTGLVNATVYDLNVDIDGSNYNVTVTADASYEFGELATDLTTSLNTAYPGSSCVLESEGHFHIYSGDGTKVIIKEGTGANPLLAALAAHVPAILAGIVTGTTVIANDPDSLHYSHTYHYANEANTWVEISGPGSIGDGLHLTYSGNQLNVDFSDANVYIPTKLGIGESSPTLPLHLKDTSPRFRLEDSDGGYAHIEADNGNLFLVSDNANTIPNSFLSFGVDGTERARFDNSGNLIIGSTVPNFGAVSHGLSISGASAYEGLRVQTTNGSGGIVEIYGESGIGTIDGRGYPLRFVTASEAVRVTDTLRVGITTTTPNRKLHIHEPSASGSYVNITNTVTGSASTDGLVMGVAGDGQAYIIQTANNNLRIRTNDIDRMLVNNTGGVDMLVPTSGVALTASGRNGDWAGRFRGHNTSGASYGLLIDAGTTSADTAFQIRDASTANTRLRVLGTGTFDFYQSSITNYTEQLQDHGTGGNFTVNPVNAPTHKMTFNTLTPIITLPSGLGGSKTYNVVIETTTGVAGVYNIAWSANVKFSGATEPSPSATASAVDIYSLFTTDGGTNWWCFQAGKGMG